MEREFTKEELSWTTDPRFRSYMSELLGKEIDFNYASLQSIDEWIEAEKKNPTLTGNILLKMKYDIGFFLGSVIKQDFGGRWMVEDGQMFIDIGETSVLCHRQVELQFDNTDSCEGNLTNLYDTVGSHFSEQARLSEISKLLGEKIGGIRHIDLDDPNNQTPEMLEFLKSIKPIEPLK